MDVKNNDNYNNNNKNMKQLNINRTIKVNSEEVLEN
jgi:hypothetical protein